MNRDLLDVTPDTWITGEYPIDHDMDINTLTELYVVVYKIERKGRDDEEIYTFTTDFEQAYKRFKLLPNTQGYLKRIFTDDATLIGIAQEGTKPKIDPSDPRLVEGLEDLVINDEDGPFE